ncbi:MAG TPA: DegT/DnrJ/EryC1/StrS family aminotransferase [Propionibacteriaceae bacterium]|mgnify:FL=1|nr:DegT/DnrJ/EryC1/StrS family aminotransferase [Propionibacteriaceae bacterium]
MELLPFALPDIGEAEIEAAVTCLRSGWLTTGPNARAFEQEFAAFVGAEHAVAVNSATAGLHLAYEALGIGPGDEVLVPTWTFTATAEAVRYLGADPVFVDVDPRTYCIDVALAAESVTRRTKAIAPVHFAGRAVPEQDLRALADAHDLRIVDDAAHSFPTWSDGQLIGGQGHEATVFSFYATKTITTGEGGMVVTPDPDLAARMRTMRLHGISRDIFNRYTDVAQRSWFYEVVAPGYKYNLTDMAAAIGRVQLTRANELRDRRAEIAAQYAAGLAGLPLTLPPAPPSNPQADSTHAWHLYVVQIDDGAPLDRDATIDALTGRGIGTSVHFIPLHLQPYWRDTYQLTTDQFPVATDLFNRSFSLPIYTRMTDADVDRVIAAVREVLGA